MPRAKSGCSHERARVSRVRRAPTTCEAWCLPAKHCLGSRPLHRLAPPHACRDLGSRAQGQQELAAFLPAGRASAQSEPSVGSWPGLGQQQQPWRDRKLQGSSSGVAQGAGRARLQGRAVPGHEVTFLPPNLNLPLKSPRNPNEGTVLGCGGQRRRPAGSRTPPKEGSHLQGSPRAGRGGKGGPFRGRSCPALLRPASPVGLSLPTATAPREASSALTG